jgi:hypothetical protein
MKKKKPFDWNDFLDNAMKKKPTKKDHRKITDLAGDWVTCACGSQCDIIDRDWEGRPLDDELYALGNDFFYYIESADWKDAKSVLNEIEGLSAKLIDKKIKDSIKILKKFNYKVTKA